jgi:rhomboid protease GluP
MDPRRMCANCRAFIDASDRTCPYCGEKVGPRAVDVRSPRDVLGGFIPHARFVTVMILLVNAALYVATALFSMRSGNDNAFMNIDGETLFYFGAKHPLGVFNGQWWRLITAGFLHGGLFHIAMNSWVLFDLGAQVEELFEWPRMVVFYFLSTVGGFAASVWFSPALSVGASAGLFGLIGVMLAVGVKRRDAMGAAIRGLYIRWIIYVTLIGFLFNIDHYAHFGGLAAGFLASYFTGEPRIGRSETPWKAAAYLCLVITGLAFLNMYVWFSSIARQSAVG